MTQVENTQKKNGPVCFVVPMREKPRSLSLDLYLITGPRSSLGAYECIVSEELGKYRAVQEKEPVMPGFPSAGCMRSFREPLKIQISTSTI